MEQELKYLFSFDGRQLKCTAADLPALQIWPTGTPGPLLLPPRLRIELDLLGVKFRPEDGVPTAPIGATRAKFRCGYDFSVLEYESGKILWYKFCTVRDFLSEPGFIPDFPTYPGISFPPKVDDFQHMPERARWQLIALSHLF